MFTDVVAIVAIRDFVPFFPFFPLSIYFSGGFVLSSFRAFLMRESARDLREPKSPVREWT